MTNGFWSVGSISTHVGTLIGWSNIPSTISGTTFNNMVEQEINVVEQYTSNTISSDAIPEKYQPTIIDLTYSKLLLSIDSNTGGADSIKLGELSVSANSSSKTEIAKQMRIDAITRLKELQRTVRFKRVIGG